MPFTGQFGIDLSIVGESLALVFDESLEEPSGSGVGGGMQRIAIIKPVPGATIDYGHQINRGLIGWWLFNEFAGSRVADISGNANHGTITDVDLTAAWTGSPHGGALALDGVDDHVIVPRSHSLRPLTSITVVARVIGTGVGSNDAVLGHWLSTGGQRSWLFQTAADPSLFAVNLSDDGTLGAGNRKNYLSSIASLDGNLHQIAFTFNGPSSTLQLFVDGALDNNVTKSDDDAINSLHDSTGDLVFGAQNDGGASHWSGAIDDIKIYNRALTPLEIQQLNTDPYLGILA